MRTEPHEPLSKTQEPFLRYFRGTIVGLAVFAAFGTVSAVWANPFFVRMTPVGSWEFPATAIMGILAGITAALWVPHCRVRGSGSGGVAGFVGIACPTCNKILMLLFGGPAFLAWFDPIRPYVASGGIAMMALAAFRVWRTFRESRALSPAVDLPAARTDGGSS